MTQEQKRMKLAKADGEDNDSIVRGLIPDYFNDLNAVHDLENVLNDEQARTYAYALYDLANGFQFDGDPWTPDIFEASMGGVVDMVRATAANRAEAIGLTLNLW
jgi:hypothetical protein